jgi:hypothetical protein
MVSSVREQYNAQFSIEKYKAFLDDTQKAYNFDIAFRIAETPVFIDKSFKEMLMKAGEEIIDFLVRPDYKLLTEKAIPKGLFVPNETDHTHFLALDFAVCKDKSGEWLPQLIELQGFASLFGFEDFIAHQYRKHFFVPDQYSHLFHLDDKHYKAQLYDIIVGWHDPKNVVLLEIDPTKQGTAIDLVITEKLLGLKLLHIGDVKRAGKKLFYEEDGKRIDIKRIYNRIIFDEFVQRKDLYGKCDFNLTEDADVEWAGHPNWFFRISKYIMPMLKSKYVPECRLLSEYNNDYPEDLENYVFKPLFSFSGSGVKFHCSQADIDAVTEDQRDQFMLQRKVHYESCVKAGDEGWVKPELRLLYFWNDGDARPHLVINLARLSRGEMIGVKYNKDKTWVGGTVGLYEI